MRQAPANRPPTPDRPMTDMRHGTGYRGRGGGHDIGSLDPCVGHCRSDRDSAVVIHLDRLQALHPADVDEMREMGQPQGEHRKKALPTGKHLAVPAVRCEQCDRLVDRVRSVVVKRRHLHCGSPSDRPGFYALYDGRSFVFTDTAKATSTKTRPASPSWHPRN